MKTLKNYLFLLFLAVMTGQLQAMEQEGPATKQQKVDSMDIEPQDKQMVQQRLISPLLSLATNYALDNFNNLGLDSSLGDKSYLEDKPNPQLAILRGQINAQLETQNSQLYGRLQLPEIVKFFGEEIAYMTQIDTETAPYPVEYDSIKDEPIKKFMIGLHNALKNNLLKEDCYAYRNKFIYFNNKELFVVDKTETLLHDLEKGCKDAKNLEELLQGTGKVIKRQKIAIQKFDIKGNTLAIQYVNADIDIFRIDSFEAVHRFDSKHYVFSLNHDGSLIAFQVGEYLKVHNTQSGEVVFTSPLHSSFEFAKHHNKLYYRTDVNDKIQDRIVDFDNHTELILPITPRVGLWSIKWNDAGTRIQLFNHEGDELFCYIIHLDTNSVDKILLPDGAPSFAKWLDNALFGFSLGGINGKCFVYNAQTHQYILYEYEPKLSQVFTLNEQEYTSEEKLLFNAGNQMHLQKTADNKLVLQFYLNKNGTYNLALDGLVSKIEECNNVQTIQGTTSLIEDYEGKQYTKEAFLEKVNATKNVPQCVKDAFHHKLNKISFPAR